MKKKTTKSKKIIKVVKWISIDEADKYPETPTPMLGGFFGLNVSRFNGKPIGRQEGKRWKDYIGAFVKEARPYLEAIREDVLKKKLTYTGEDHQDKEDGCPVFNDGKACLMSWRAWGDLMAAIWSTEDDKDYCYMDFYMGHTKVKKDD